MYCYVKLSLLSQNTVPFINGWVIYERNCVLTYGYLKLDLKIKIVFTLFTKQEVLLPKGGRTGVHLLYLIELRCRARTGGLYQPRPRCFPGRDFFLWATDKCQGECRACLVRLGYDSALVYCVYTVPTLFYSY